MEKYLKFLQVNNLYILLNNNIYKVYTYMSIIGEGGFGCVHKPSLECNTNQIVDYDDKVSKLLTKKQIKN